MRALLLLAIGFAGLSQQACGMTWRWSNPLPHGNNIIDMAWNGDLCVQVAELGQVYTGNDFFGWLPQESGTSNDLQAVKFFGNRIVFVGANGTVGYSDDGVTFNAASLGTANWLVDLAVSTNLLVAVGDNAVIYTSSDGAAWDYMGTAPGAGSHWLLSAAWGEGTFAITGEGGYIASSTNGVNWTSRASPVAQDLTRVAWVSTTNALKVFPFSGFWAVTDEGAAIYSTNRGADWASLGNTGGTNVLYALAANDNNGLVAGDSAIRLSYNGKRWFDQTSVTNNPPAPAWLYYNALWDTNGAFRLAGANGMLVEGASTNGIYTWSQDYPSTRDWLWQAALANGLYVTVGDHARIMTSPNGIDWSIEALPETNSISASNTVFLAVGGDTNLLLALGTGGSLAESLNTSVEVTVTNQDGTLTNRLVSTFGVVWSSFPAPAHTTNDLAAVCVFNDQFFVSGGNGTLLRSPNGTNWTSVPTPTSNYLSGLAASTNLVVCTGDQGTVLTSPDGTNWTAQVSTTTNWLFRVRWLGGCFITGGENGTILTSTNGQKWMAEASGTTNWLNDIVLISNSFWIVGDNGAILTRASSVSWSNVACITSQSLCGAATQNGQLVVVGTEGSILRSPVIPDLNPIQFLSYGQSSGQNVFVVAGAPDQQFTLDWSTNLVDWVTGPTLSLIYGSGTLIFTTPVNDGATTAQFYRATPVP